MNGKDHRYDVACWDLDNWYDLSHGVHVKICAHAITSAEYGDTMAAIIKSLEN